LTAGRVDVHPGREDLDVHPDDGLAVGGDIGRDHRACGEIHGRLLVRQYRRLQGRWTKDGDVDVPASCH